MSPARLKGAGGDDLRFVAATADPLGEVAIHSQRILRSILWLGAKVANATFYQ
jgi:hypothetical protein